MSVVYFTFDLLFQGHAPAGGCLLSLCCDYRIMAENYGIGLNETQLVSQVHVIHNLVHVK